MYALFANLIAPPKAGLVPTEILPDALTLAADIVDALPPTVGTTGACLHTRVVSELVVFMKLAAVNTDIT